MRTAIVGAGITGLYLAWKLAERGEDVSVFEKRPAVGKQACSGLFSERILELIPQSRKLIQNTIESAFIHFPKRTIKIGFSKKFCVMSHADLDNLAASLAGKAGAKIILNKAVDSIPSGFDRVVGCDGPNSSVRKWLKLKEPQCRLAIQGFVSKRDSSDFVETWPVDRGFIWKIPRGGETEYGIIAGLKTAKVFFEEFLKRNGLKLERMQAAVVPQGFLIPSNSSVTLCGDAAGLTKPWSGGGVVWGLTAADFLLKSFPDFLKYRREMRKFFPPKILFSKLSTKAVYFAGNSLPWLLPKSVKIEGDFLH